MKVDFSDVQESGRILATEGQFVFKVKNVTEEESNAGSLYLKWILEVVGGPDCTPAEKGAIVYMNTSLKPKALWKLRQVIQGLGIKVPKGVMELNLRKMKNMKLEATTKVTEWEGKRRAEVDNIIDKAFEATSSTESLTPGVEVTMDGKTLTVAKVTDDEVLLIDDEGESTVMSKTKALDLLGSF